MSKCQKKTVTSKDISLKKNSIKIQSKQLKYDTRKQTDKLKFPVLQENLR